MVLIIRRVEENLPVFHYLNKSKKYKMFMHSSLASVHGYT